MATIEFSEEQSMLMETAVDFCRKHASIDRVRGQLEQELSADPAVWQEMVDLGWLGIVIPESYGGLGLSLADVVPIVESMGRHLMGSAFVPTTLAAQALITSGSDDQKSQWLPEIAAGAPASIALTEEDGNWNLTEVGSHAELQGDQVRLTAKKNFVLDGNQASVIVVSANIDGAPSLVVVKAEQLPEGALVGNRHRRNSPQFYP